MPPAAPPLAPEEGAPASGLTSGVRLSVLVETPQHSGLLGPLDYRAERAWPPGTLVRVPLGRRTVTGLVWETQGDERWSLAQLKDVVEVFESLYDQLVTTLSG